MSLRPPHIDPEENPLRRKVAMAYRTAREVGKSHIEAEDAAMAVYLSERPEAAADRLAASSKVAQMIASAVSADPAWFWKNVPRS